jgi:predicted HAD superfamily Cof-like phosphohydrolase
MTSEQAMVEEFHAAFDILRRDTPGIPDKTTRELRCELIREELDELRAAFADGDIVEVADALADLLYVTYGTAVSCGIDMEPVFREVHRSNMTKVGGYKRDDGKWVKPETYSPADIATVLEAQGGAAEGGVA